MAIPVFGMFVGLLVAVFFSYRKKRVYEEVHVEPVQQSISSELDITGEKSKPEISKFTLSMAELSKKEIDD